MASVPWLTRRIRLPAKLIVGQRALTMPNGRGTVQYAFAWLGSAIIRQQQIWVWLSHAASESAKRKSCHMQSKGLASARIEVRARIEADPRLGSGRLGSQFGHCELRGRARGQAQMPCQLSSLADKPAFCWPARANPVDNCWHRARYNEVGCTGAQQRGKGGHCVCH